ncbi:MULTISPECIES: hypothetical protein [Streptomyces]|uniref:Uncharacterized protein n=2 Tax=Streptomyces TaxID=1883 RepID=A0A2N8PMY2_STRNR|nr:MULTISPECIES: hypothetical protein [Streptomyces]PNE42382.1 hypothetical protein AOB60_18055 [Streptomyces noursei]QRX92360.1 hypothetical protein JNO44_17175 [Streptomyces noursei]UJB42088.1 hypothetical protein HRD51_15700 [Streptomyces sp. A1-5]SHK79788.1 hypothetical protein SAMN05216268_101348 [Streptomyces yunnanensis]
MDEFDLDARVIVSADPAQTSLSPVASVASRVASKWAVKQTIRQTIKMTAACAAVRTNGKC